MELKLAGCDGGQKEDGYGPENVLQTSWSCTQTRNSHMYLLNNKQLICFTRDVIHLYTVSFYLL